MHLLPSDLRYTDWKDSTRYRTLTKKPPYPTTTWGLPPQRAASQPVRCSLNGTTEPVRRLIRCRCSRSLRDGRQVNGRERIHKRAVVLTSGGAAFGGAVVEVHDMLLGVDVFLRVRTSILEARV